MKTPTLADAQLGQSYWITGLNVPANMPDWSQRLMELGFFPGERVRVLRHALPGKDPLAVRVGASSFALRRAEAQCVRIEPLPHGTAG